jgi:hypothetical protein
LTRNNPTKIPYIQKNPRIFLIIPVQKHSHVNRTISNTGGQRTPHATTTLQHVRHPVLHELWRAHVNDADSQCVHAQIGVLRVGRTVNLLVIPFKRKQVGPKYQGTMLFMKMLQHNVMPERVDNFYACAKNSETTVRYIRVQDLCTLLAEVEPRTGAPNMVNLVPIAHAFPVSWVVS